MAKAGYGDLEVGAETTSPQAIHPQGTATIPGITFSADTDTGVYRAGANIVGVAVGGTGQITVTDGVLLPVTTNDIDLGSSSVQFKDAFIDGTLEADAITIGGSTLASVIAGTTVTNATNITVADSTDTTCFVGLWESVTGAQAPKSDAGITYNAGTGMLTATGLTGPLTGVASTATALASARTIGGVSFDGTGNIDLPGVNTAGNQATSGLAATATLAATTTALASARTIGGVSFDGTGNIDLPGVNSAGNQATSGLAATATLAAASTTVTVTDNESTSENNLIAFVANAGDATGNHGLEMDGNLTYNPSTGLLTATSFSGTVTGTSAFTRGPAFFMS